MKCVHPFVTLLEKLDALQKKARSEKHAPAAIVRHFEDAAAIIDATTLPDLDGYATPKALASEMAAQRQIKAIPAMGDPAFVLSDDERTKAIRKAHEEIAPMFWGRRISLEDATATIRKWIGDNLA